MSSREPLSQIMDESTSAHWLSYSQSDFASGFRGTRPLRHAEEAEEVVLSFVPQRGGRRGALLSLHGFHLLFEVMPYLRTYKLFISHAWHRDEDYFRVAEWLNSAPNFDWEDLSVPEHEAIDTKELGRTIQYHLHAYMRDACAFILCAGLYASHSEWIDYEVNFARRIGCPIIAVAPWGAQRLPRAAAYADHTVSRADSLVHAIRAYALDEGE
jgi:hypothetical protein